MARERKQDILNELTDLLGLPRRRLRPGGGSSLPSDVFVTAAQRVGVASGGEMPVVAERVAKKAGTPWLARYDSRHTRSGGGSTVTRDGLRAFVDAVRALLDAGVGPQAFLILWNPARWEWLAEDLAAAIAATAAGQLVERSWSTGGRILDIEEGDRAYLLRQGNEPRGIVAAGWFRGGVYQDAHWDGSDRLANYADIDFDAVVDPHSPMGLAELQASFPQQHWTPQGGGTRIADGIREDLDEMWRNHVQAIAHDSSGQSLQRDSLRRKAIEDAAQDRLMRHFRDLGWHVEDTRIGNPFDARATKEDETLYLEAKGTMTAGSTVLVTRGEVEWALRHPGRCVIGILSGVRIASDGLIDPDSGELSITDWRPKKRHLTPQTYMWAVQHAPFRVHE